MSPNFMASIYVSISALGVIFVVLGILILTINILVRLIPYQAPPTPPARKQAVVKENVEVEMEEHVAAITAGLAATLGKSPSEFQIVNIQQL